MEPILENLSKIAQDAQNIAELEFGKPSVYPAAVLGSTEWFTGNLIRQAQAHEQALFVPSSSMEGRGGLDELATMRRRGRRTWQAAKRPAPERKRGVEQASPLKTNPARSSKPDDQTERYLRAAHKLLQIYVMPRAKDHVDSLLARYESISDSISEREEALKTPLSQGYANISDTIKHEELELVALQDLVDTQEKELERLDAKIKTRKRQKLERERNEDSDRSHNSSVQNTADGPAEDISGEQSTAPPPPETPPNLRAGAQAETPPTVFLSAADGDRPAEASAESPNVPATPGAPSEPGNSRTTPVAKSSARKSDTPMKTGSIQSDAVTNDKPANEMTMSTYEEATSSEPSEEFLRRQSLGEEISIQIWDRIGDTLKPFVNGAEENAEFRPSSEDTLHALAAVTEAGKDESNTSEAVGDGVQSISPGLALEALLLKRFLETLLSHTPPEQVQIVMRPSPFNPAQKLPFYSFTEMKRVLGDEAKQRGWGEELGAKAIYGLVGKRCLRIDRRIREALLGWDMQVEGSLE